ncbi:MAG TPA: glycosyltransferase [Gemmataceae bacterium]|jgi:glycosyltransferase involved in cell wall biosynthesis|nr:glycosyltransferase [Gemmataceae bacterium]
MPSSSNNPSLVGWATPSSQLSNGVGKAVSPRRRPIRILEFRGAEGSGGGPEKTILVGAARSDPERFAVTVCYIRDLRDSHYEIDARARKLGIDYFEVQQRRLFDLGIVRATRRLLQQHRFDIIHAHDYKTNLLALLLARREKVIPLSTAHGWCGHTFREKFLYYPVDKWLLARFPLVIAVSSQIREELMQHGARPGRVRTVLNGIDHRAFRRDKCREASVKAKFGIRPEEFVVGTMARLEPVKRFDLLLKVFARLVKSHPSLRLLIAGEGSFRPALETLAGQLGLDPARCFLGHCPDVVELHHAFDLFVQASDYEGTPNVVLEAMAMETPIVATDAGGTGEVMQDGIHGLLVPSGNGDLLAQAIERALGSRAQRMQRVAAARKRVEHELSFETRMRAVEGIYEELAAK